MTRPVTMLAANSDIDLFILRIYLIHRVIGNANEEPRGIKNENRGGRAIKKAAPMPLSSLSQRILMAALKRHCPDSNAREDFSIISDSPFRNISI
jgi:hypothetical protein